MGAELDLGLICYPTHHSMYYSVGKGKGPVPCFGQDGLQKPR